MLSLEFVSCHVPKNILPITSVQDRLGLTQQQIKVYTTFYGLHSIALADDDEIISMIMQPVSDVIQTTGIDKNKIKYLIHCHTGALISPFGQSIVRQIREELDLSRATVFSTTLNKCTSIIAAFDLADKLLMPLAEDEKIIILSGEIAFSHELRIAHGISLIGDSSAAVLVGKRTMDNRLCSSVVNIAGRYSKGVWLNQADSNDLAIKTPHFLVSTIQEALQHANIPLEQLSLLLPHNVNFPAWRNTAKLLNFPLDKIYLKNIEKYGHCFGTDLLLNYRSSMDNNLLSKGDYYMMACIGIGSTFAAAVFCY